VALPPINASEETFKREVDEELRRDQLISVWQRYGRWLVAAAVLLLAAWGGWLWWQARETKAAGVEGENFATALDKLQANDDKGAEATLKELSKSERDGYRAAAKLSNAAVLLGRGDNAGAAKGFAAVASDDSVAQPFRDLALVRQTAAEFDTLKPQEIIARLQPLAVKGNAFFGSAGEMVAVAYINTGQPARAGALYAEIGKDETVPETIRSRAVQMAGALGVDAVNPAGKETSE
jgi:hypothetical protein